MLGALPVALLGEGVDSGCFDWGDAMSGHPDVPTFTVHSPHGEWETGISLYPGDYLPAREFVGHALRQLVPLSQHEFVWYLTENGRRIPDDENLYASRDRSFNLVMELTARAAVARAGTEER